MKISSNNRHGDRNFGKNFFIIAMIGLSAGFIQCTKEASPDLKPDEEAGELASEIPGYDPAQEARFENMIKTAAIGIMDLSRTSGFRKLVTQHVMQQFDEDDNVLLKTLADVYAGGEGNLAQEFQSSIHRWQEQVRRIDESEIAIYGKSKPYSELREIDKSVNGFDFYVDETMYIQIYIPFVEEVNLDADPIIALGMEDECETDGYYIDEDGQIRLMRVTESAARENLVWVVSVNETVDNNGRLPEQPEDIIDPDAVSTRSMDNSVRIRSIKITDKKECWLCGKADVSIIIPAVDYYCNEGAQPFKHCFLSVRSSQVNKELTVEEVLYPSRFYSRNYQPLKFHEYIGWIFYEKDVNRRKYRKKSTLAPCLKEYEWYSKQTTYGIEKFFYMDPRDIWVWHDVGNYVYYGDVNTPSGSSISFDMIRVNGLAPYKTDKIKAVNKNTILS